MRSNPNRLLVEGKDDQFAIAELMGSHIPWPDKRERADWPVEIEVGDSVDEILEPGFLSAKLKASDIRRLGLMIDADDQLDSRWGRVREYCLPEFPSMPRDLPREGLVLVNARGNRFGVWMMPDNASRGMLETFLQFLVKDDGKPLLTQAVSSVEAARAAGAPCRSVHIDKAIIHTWLAWQDPPGHSFGRAIVAKMLDPGSPSAAAFVAWFRRLFEV